MLNGRKFWNPTPHPTTAASAASNQFNRTATCCVSGWVFRQAGAGKTKVIDDTIRKWGSVSLCELTASQPFACVSIVIKWWHPLHDTTIRLAKPPSISNQPHCHPPPTTASSSPSSILGANRITSFFGSINYRFASNLFAVQN